MNDMLSQEEIDALLKGEDTSKDSNKEERVEFSDEEKDAIGEIGNISMGTAATTLSTLLGHKVSITTPRVEAMSVEEITKEYPLPFIAVDVKYKQGIEGTNLLILKQRDVKVITSLMMGGDAGDVEEDTEPLSDVHLSAIGEAMNQMIGSASTSLSEMFNRKIDINPPKAFELDLSSDRFDEYISEDVNIYAKISFSMKIGDFIDSEIMQLIPMSFAKEMIEILLGGQEKTEEEAPKAAEPEPEPKKTEPESPQPQQNPSSTRSQAQAAAAYSQPKERKPEASQERVNVQPAQFQSFDEGSTNHEPENISLIRDVPLKVTVELGRTVKKIHDVLDFGPGTIIELDKLVGEPLDILVNGQYVAKGEVVVIDENYGIRVTDIVKPEKRIGKL
ncbi:flagellar motor switch phosphatase FliY [Isachenkonia alkalipeptolytica]|uniref:Flagellar motor switch phosphatase FliY n=1 Tax=Isachenkonia alkalipeptolytica TaxID=2565777 RepID=A0AA43XJ92_9CLOT|nr:flagellar motor switch phosphatase FliY [Isachenkonia alkalipeptolytica]NBG87577.1 flagellar motor switch phosphatase FliY [Isachenkonia alkalipeptolytica]